MTRPVGLKQPPTSVAPTRDVAVTPPGKVVPVGKVSVMRLLAAPESAAGGREW